MNSRSAARPETLVHHIAHWARLRPEEGALHEKVGGRWRRLSWAQYWASVRGIGKGLIALGHEVGQSVAIVGANRPQWVQCQFGAQAARGFVAPIYTTNTVEQLAHIVSNSEARFIVCDGQAQLEKILEAESRGLFERLARIITFEEIAHEDPRVLSVEALIELGAETADAALDARLDAIEADETCLLIYTSGTTGVPKGVMLNHGGQLMTARGIMNKHPSVRDGEEAYRAISYLPLCHQAEQLVTNVVGLYLGGEIFFCPDIKAIKEYLTEVRPTIFLGVPRVWEKFEAALRARLGEAKGLRAKLASWAMRTEGEAFAQELRAGAPVDSLRRRVARKLVVDKVKAALGLDQLAAAVTGSAPLGVATQEFFASLGIPIYEGYGMSETSGISTITDPSCLRFGTVGTALDGVEIRIAEDGEILLRGANNTIGYFRMPEQTEELYAEDGWLCTGDLGELDSMGALRITGRKKELIITAGGKNVAPVELEHHMQGIAGIAQAVVVGDRRPFLCAILTLDPENLEALAEASG
ncbi:MAG: long-chain fatty acid--CoA ligase, partial [Myxococcales bacterium]|nr:long-chain fatty acid--CoA ligase [Myxococcales bacterium]